jgi:hypothetical protein
MYFSDDYNAELQDLLLQPRSRTEQDLRRQMEVRRRRERSAAAAAPTLDYLQQRALWQTHNLQRFPDYPDLSRSRQPALPPNTPDWRSLRRPGLYDNVEILDEDYMDSLSADDDIFEEDEEEDGDVQ